MNLRSTLSLSCVLAWACTSTPASDDESNVTTAMSESATTSSTPPVTDTDTTTTDTTTTTDASTSASSGSESFIVERDFFEGFCDSIHQVCPDGDKCVPYAIEGGEYPNANKCVPVLGEGQPGDPCTFDGFSAATDNCNALSRCLVQDGSMMGTCVAFCTGTPEAPLCEGDLQCVMGFDGAVADCLPQCHPASPASLDHYADPCGEGHCLWTGTEFDCVDVGPSLPAGAACEFVNDCTPGTVCAAAAMVPGCEGLGCCVPYCVLLAGCQQPGSECVPFFEPGAAPLGLADLGVCLVP